MQSRDWNRQLNDKATTLVAVASNKRGFNWTQDYPIYLSWVPFDEDVDIEDQISSAQLLYPDKPWPASPEEQSTSQDVVKQELLVSW